MSTQSINYPLRTHAALVTTTGNGVITLVSRTPLIVSSAFGGNTGEVDIAFVSALPSNDYLVLPTATHSPAAAIAAITVSPLATTGFTVVVRDAAGTPLDLSITVIALRLVLTLNR